MAESSYLVASLASSSASNSQQYIPSSSDGSSSNIRVSEKRRSRGGRTAQPKKQDANTSPSPKIGGPSAIPDVSNRLLAMRPATVSPLPESISSDTKSASPAVARHPPSATRKGNRRGRGGTSATANRGRANHQNSTTVLHGRQFVGSLTVDDTAQPNPEPPTSRLQPDAPEFLPSGQQLDDNIQSAISSKQQRASRTVQPRKRRLSKSTAPDLATRVHEDIDNKQYECAICTNEVLRNSKIWSCHTCWTVFHLECVKKWATNSEKSAAAAQQLQAGDLQPMRHWRCPGCNLPQETKPKQYECWCGKELEPRPINGLPPHSCGQTCGKARLAPSQCPHPCELLCHAGPCPTCTHMGPRQLCYCGKESTTRRCTETNYDSGWSCGKICEDIMPCNKHICPQPCHLGVCGACESPVDARCYCGKDEKTLLCCDQHEEKFSTKPSENNDEKLPGNWLGVYQCQSLCERLFDCEIHSCQRSCHPQDETITTCPFSPDLITRCPCGKTPLVELLETPRRSCEDSIPNCTKPCHKMLPCGHECQQVCHDGDCLPCGQPIMIRCRCGRTTETRICYESQDEPPKCGRTCHVTLNCGRHECGVICCSGERKAAERQSLKKKGRPLGSTRMNDDGFEAEHICTRICGRLLKCGRHHCASLCHKGQCESCREAIFDDITCHCGKTILQAPLPCGTGVPYCRFQCIRPTSCGHPKVDHHCHSGDQPCPKCPYLTEKICMCGKKALKNQQCWVTGVRCGEVCGKRLKCGSHTCLQSCHRPGECEDANRACAQTCNKPKKSCGHPCERQCHSPYPCREEKPCSHQIMVTCPCQHNKQEMRCGATVSSEGNTLKELKCDEECARLERNRKLAIAFHIDPQTHQDLHIPYSYETLSLFRDNASWCQDQERELRVFATSEDERRLRFKPMPSHQRAFLHALAADFGFDSESMDPEPHRHVAIFKTPKFLSAPNKTLRDCIRIRQSQTSVLQQTKAKAPPMYHSSNASDPYNGFLLTSARFALTIDEVESEIAAVQGPSPRIQFSVHFLPSSDAVALKARIAQIGTSVSEWNIDSLLRELKMPITRALIATHSFGASLHLARYDDTLAILRRDDDVGSTDGAGWSKVAAKAAASVRPTPTPETREKNSFMILSTMNNAKKKAEEGVRDRINQSIRKKGKEEDVFEDWELAEQMEEDREQRIAVEESAAPINPGQNE